MIIVIIEIIERTERSPRNERNPGRDGFKPGADAPGCIPTIRYEIYWIYNNND